MSLGDLQDLAASYFVHPAKIALTQGKTRDFGIVLFEINSAELSNQSKQKGESLNLVSKAFSDQGLEIQIEGHTDSTGEGAYNLDLSNRRAQSVKEHLVQTYGIDSTRLTTKGYGESKPAVSNDTSENRSKNRRIEFKVLQATSAPMHLQNVLNTISDWVSKPGNQSKVERAKSATWVEDQYKRNKKYLEYMEKLSKKHTGDNSDLSKFMENLNSFKWVRE